MSLDCRSFLSEFRSLYRSSVFFYAVQVRVFLETPFTGEEAALKDHVPASALGKICDNLFKQIRKKTRCFVAAVFFASFSATRRVEFIHTIS